MTVYLFPRRPKVFAMALVAPGLPYHVTRSGYRREMTLFAEDDDAFQRFSREG